MKYKGLKIKNVMLLAILMLPALTQAAAVSVFVDSGNTNGPWDGRSWNTAFKSIQRGIDTAYNAGGGDVWVVAGTYYPTNKTNRSKSFQLKSGTNVYGGFNGTETALNQRDWKTNPTTLSGDIGKKGKKEDNSFHVVIGADNALLDGFTITGGYGIGGSGRPGGRGRGFRPGEGGFRGRGGRPPQMGPGSGGQRRPGGIHTSPQAILSGIQQGTGAGMVNYQTAPVVRNCAFKDNHAFKGGAVYNLSPGSFPHQGNSGTRKQPVFENSSFIGNSAKGRGGAMANDMRTHPVIAGCRFIDNKCDAKGGAIYNDFGCSPLIANCLFDGNRAYRAGAVGNDGGSSPFIVACTFVKNRAEDSGAALYQGTGPSNNPKVARSIIWANVCDNGPAGIYNWHDCSVTVTDSCVQGEGTDGTGNKNAGSDPKFRDMEGGDYSLSTGSPYPNAGYTASPPGIREIRQWKASLGRFRRGNVSKEQESRSQDGKAVYYVKRGNLSQDGLSWDTAFDSLQTAMDAAYSSGGEVWVVAGTYKPSVKDRWVSFKLRAGVSVYGGFSGSETSLQQRRPARNITILSGEIGDPVRREDNSYHVLTGADGAMLDGFTITGGYADGKQHHAKGGGLLNYQPAQQGPPGGRNRNRVVTGFSTTVVNCTFRNNYGVSGGAVYNYDGGKPVFKDCRFLENNAGFGGAVVDRVGVRAVYTGCIFQNNHAYWRGGAMLQDYGSRPTISNCTFKNNGSDRHGGALVLVSRASQLENTIVTITGSTFRGNRAGNLGGAVINNDRSILKLQGCRFEGNRANAGGAIANRLGSTAIIKNCTFVDNRASEGKADIDSDKTSRVGDKLQDRFRDGHRGRDFSPRQRRF